MLGKLARELRLLGMDVEYDRNLGGMQAYRAARIRGRILLTRTNRLRGLPGTLYILSQLAPEQVAQVKAEIDAGLKPVTPLAAAEAVPPESAKPAPIPQAPKPAPTHPAPKPAPVQREKQEEEGPFTRCLACNARLEKISREQARPTVPFFVYQIHHEFRRCPKCRKVFWPGNHVADMGQRARQQAPVRRRRR
jgi:uncharacterized protein with PIN domain